MNVGLTTAERARTAIDHGVPELAREVERDRVSVSAAADSSYDEAPIDLFRDSRRAPVNESSRIATAIRRPPPRR
jgi:hypothetical protein